MSMRFKANGLTDKEDKFAKAVASGETLADSYRLAYETKTEKPESVRAQASAVASRERVKSRIAELQAMVDDGDIANIKQISADLWKIASDETKPDGVRLKAYDQLTKIQGGYTDGVNVTLTGAIGIDGIEQKIAEMLAD